MPFRGAKGDIHANCVTPTRIRTKPDARVGLPQCHRKARKPHAPAAGRGVSRKSLLFLSLPSSFFLLFLVFLLVVLVVLAALLTALLEHQRVRPLRLAADFGRPGFDVGARRASSSACRRRACRRPAACTRSSSSRSSSCPSSSELSLLCVVIRLPFSSTSSRSIVLGSLLASTVIRCHRYGSPVKAVDQNVLLDDVRRSRRPLSPQRAPSSASSSLLALRPAAHHPRPLQFLLLGLVGLFLLGRLAADQATRPNAATQNAPLRRIRMTSPCCSDQAVGRRPALRSTLNAFHSCNCANPGGLRARCVGPARFSVDAPAITYHVCAWSIIFARRRTCEGQS